MSSLRATLAAGAGLVCGWGVWLLCGLVLDATVGTQCRVFCISGEPGHAPGCIGNPQACPLSSAHLAATAGSALLGILVASAALWFLRRPAAERA
jgi:hypothetical protein